MGEFSISPRFLLRISFFKCKVIENTGVCRMGGPTFASSASFLTTIIATLETQLRTPPHNFACSRYLQAAVGQELFQCVVAILSLWIFLGYNYLLCYVLHMPFFFEYWNIITECTFLKGKITLGVQLSHFGEGLEFTSEWKQRWNDGMNITPPLLLLGLF